MRFGANQNITYEYSASGLRFGDAPADTLIADSKHSPAAVDFDLSSLRLHVDLSRDLDGESGTLQLHRRGASASIPWPTNVRTGGGTISGGGLDVELTGVLPGWYKFELVVGRRGYRCNCPYDGEHIWIPGVRDSAAAPWIEVPANQTPEITARVGSNPARIQGRITGAWLDFGLGPPSLSLFTPESTLVRGERPVAADGSFDLPMYLPGPVKLLVTHEGVDQWIGGPHFAEATTFPLETGRTISGIQFIESGLFMEVAVPYFRIEWTWFRLYDAATSTLAASWLLQNASEPRLAMPNLRPGTYRMHIEPELRGFLPWAPQWYDRAISPAGATPITIAHEGDVVRIPVVLEKGGTISGTVREIPGVRVDYFVYITRADDATRWGYTFAHRDRPSFVVKGLPDGDWKVGVRRQSTPPTYPDQPPRDTVWYPGTTTWEAAQAIATRGFEDVTGIEISMPDVQP